MTTSTLISKIAEEVEQKLRAEGSGHDWWHIYRVWKMANQIAKREKANLFVVNLAALLHDIADWKFHDGDETIGPRVATQIMSKYEIDPAVIREVAGIIRGISFKGAKQKKASLTLEGMIVQDADRLDAIGAIGIARVFTYGGYKNRILYDPAVKPILNMKKKAYMKNEGGSINHFYEKLLLLKDLMNTKTGKRIAVSRHRFMEGYLKRFFKEWDTKKYR